MSSSQFFLVFPLFYLLLLQCCFLDSILLLSSSILTLDVLRSSLLLFISFFFEFQSNMECSLPSSFPLHLLCFFLCVRSMFLQLLPYRYLRLCRSGKRHRCVDRILSLCCLLRRFHLRYLVGFLLFLFGCSSSFVVSSAWFFPSFFLYFRFVCTMRRNILRCVERIKFSCSCESVHVPEAYVKKRVMTVLNKRSLWRRRYDLDVHSCLHLMNDAQAALIRFFISVVSCCSNVIVCPRYFAHSLAGNTSTLMLSIVTSILLYDP